MNIRATDGALATGKFAVGQPVPRSEDPMLLRGEGAYTDDLNLPRQTYAVMVRSQHAHGIIAEIDTAAAKAMPGVLGVFTAADLVAGGYGTLACNMVYPNADGSPMKRPPRPVLATNKVRHVGEAVAFVVADSALAAQDAAEAVTIALSSLPAIVSTSEAVAPGAAQLHDEAPGNVALNWHFGDSAKVAKAFAEAAHVTRLDLENNRVVVNAMEPRAAIADFNKKTGRFTLHVGSQGVFGLRNAIADEVMKIPRDRLRVVTGQVGGSFGMKASVYPEYICLLHAARALGRPVKWTDKRSESFVSDHHGRDHSVVAELALDARGHFLAIRITGLGNMGAYLTHVGPMMSTLNIVKNMPSLYRTPFIEMNARCVFTTTTPLGAYRGAGRPEGNYYMERLVDKAAHEMGIDRLTLRRRNFIPPTAMPFTSASGMVYDTGDFRALFDAVVEKADVKGFAARRKASRKSGKLLGLGVGCFLEVTAPPMSEMGGIRFEKDGTITIITGTMDYGQGHATPFAQVLVRSLGVPFETVRLVQGDSDRLIAGGGTGGSKSIMASGAAIIEASAKVIEQGRQIAAHLLEAGEADVSFKAGRFSIAGTDRGIGIMEIARRINSGVALPTDLPQSLDVDHVFAAASSAYPNGCHVAEVEIDPDTGVTEVVRYTAGGDFGTVVNPLLVQGQVHGGIVQGIGQALMEQTRYDENGQLTTGSFMDYAMPRANNAPFFTFISHPVPATTNPLGAKGCGEAGCAGALPSVMNAVVDALAEHGVRHVNMPATPAVIWKTLRGA
ncbi:MAG: xanthine dehydrogenase family protein molybdopterin-binding subunit [Hyphomicrobiales bacterium]|nr:xanthine dehydrogenase family protein molybdopterin-binding subunit [Hyphomicrobiales bacterium]